VQGTIETLELPCPTVDEPENIEFFMEWDVPLECDAIQNREDEEDVDAERATSLISAMCVQPRGVGKSGEAH
jgi:hypothetical protein